MIEIGGAIAAFSALKDLGSGLINERDRQKAAAIQVDFTNQLIEAQAHLTQLLGTIVSQQGQIGALEKHVRDMEAAKAEKERYVLTKMGTEGEFFAYRLRAAAELSERVDEISHFVCQPCFEAGKKVVLSGNGDGYWWCPICKHGAQTSPTTPVRHATRLSRNDLFNW